MRIPTILAMAAAMSEAVPDRTPVELNGSHLLVNPKPGRKKTPKPKQFKRQKPKKSSFHPYTKSK